MHSKEIHYILKKPRRRYISTFILKIYPEQNIIVLAKFTTF